MNSIDRQSAVCDCWIPDGNGGFKPAPDIMDRWDAVRYLRIDTIGIKNPLDSLDYYRRKHDLRPVQISKKIFYRRSDLESLVEKLMEKNPR